MTRRLRALEPVALGCDSLERASRDPAAFGGVGACGLGPNSLDGPALVGDSAAAQGAEGLRGGERAFLGVYRA